MKELQLAILQASFETNSRAPKLAKALAEVQGEIRGIKKNKVSLATGASVSYLDGNKLYENLLPALSSRNVLVSTSVYPISNEPRQVTTSKGEVKTKFLFKGILHFQFILDSEVIQGIYPVEGDQFDDISKSMGTAVTYSDRYFLMKYFKIETDKDDADAKASEGTQVEEKPKQDLAKKAQAGSVTKAPVAKPSIKKETKPALDVTPLPQIVYTQPAEAEAPKPTTSEKVVEQVKVIAEAEKAEEVVAQPVVRTPEQVQSEIKTLLINNPSLNKEILTTIKEEMVPFNTNVLNVLGTTELETILKNTKEKLKLK